MSSLPVAQLSNEDHDNLTYLIEQAVQAVESWKAHQLRSIQTRQRTHRTLRRFGYHYGTNNPRLGHEISPSKMSRDPGRLVCQEGNFMAHKCYCT